MAVLRMNEINKLSLKDAKDKRDALERALLELAGEGKMEKKKPLKQAIARLNAYIHSKEMKAA